MRTISLLALSALLWLAAADRLRSARTTGSQPARQLAAAFAALATGALVYSPPVYVWLDGHVWRRPNVSELVGHAAIALSATLAVAMVRSMLPDPPRWGTLRHRLILAAVALLAMTVTFLAHRYPVETIDFTAEYGRAESVRIYWLTFLVFTTITLIELCIVCFRARVADPALRIGLRTVGTGASLGIIYLAHWAAYLVALALGVALTAPIMTAGPPVAALAGLLIVIGTAIPRMLPALHARRQLRAIAPITAHVRTRYPEVVRPQLGRTGAATRLYSDLIEVRDGVALARLDPPSSLDPVFQDLATAAPEGDLATEVRRLRAIVARHRLPTP